MKNIKFKITTFFFALSLLNISTNIYAMKNKSSVYGYKNKLESFLKKTKKIIEDLDNNFTCEKKELRKINEEFNEIKRTYENCGNKTFKQIEENIKKINQGHNKIDVNKNKNTTQKEKLEKINKNLEDMLKNNIIDKKELDKKCSEFDKCLNEKSNENNDNLVILILENIGKLNKKIEENTKKININKNTTQKEKLKEINKNLEDMLKNNIIDKKELEKQETQFYDCLSANSNENNNNIANKILENIDKLNKKIEENTKKINQDNDKININKNTTQKEKLKSINKNLEDMPKNNIIDKKELEKQDAQIKENKKTDEIINPEKPTKKINSLKEYLEYDGENENLIKELEKYNDIFEKHVNKISSKDYNKNLHKTDIKTFRKQKNEFINFLYNNIIKKQIKNSVISKLKAKIYGNITLFENAIKNVNFEIENENLINEFEKYNNIFKKYIKEFNPTNFDIKLYEQNKKTFENQKNNFSVFLNKYIDENIENDRIDEMKTKICDNISIFENIIEDINYEIENENLINELEKYNNIFKEYIEKVSSKNFDIKLYEPNKKIFKDQKNNFSVFLNKYINKSIENDRIDEMKTKIYDSISLAEKINKNIDSEIQNNIKNKTSKNIEPFLFYFKTMLEEYKKTFEKHYNDSETILKNLCDNSNNHENLKNIFNNLKEIEDEFMFKRFKYNILKNKNTTQKEKLESINKNLEDMLKNNIIDETELEKQETQFYDCLSANSNENNNTIANKILENIDKLNKKINNNKIKVKEPIFTEKKEITPSDDNILSEIDRKIESIEKNINDAYNNVISKILEIYIEKFNDSLESLEKIFKNENLDINKIEDRKKFEKELIKTFIEYNNFLYKNKIKFNDEINEKYIDKINELIEKSTEFIKKK